MTRESFTAAFRRNPDGSWTCIRAITFQGPGGRIQVVEGAVFRRGELFMGLDLARYIEAHARSASEMP